ncbi:MAG: aryl-sulfate sulfotransferase [Bacteroidota bacterium]|nr:aryl-sulfate sulfotransferase [Bacteroidota bacterium]
MKNLFSFIIFTALCCSILSAQTIDVKPSTTAFVFPNGVSVPSDYPHVKNLITKNNSDTGFIFINNWGGTPYIAILDNNNSPVFYRKMPSNARDFKVQANGMLSYRLADPYYRFYEMDSSYTVTREITAKNGFGTDEHDLQILPNGNALVIPLEYKTVDMSKLISGGKTNATIIGNHVQEIDPSGAVVFEWKCWDNLNIIDAVHENLTAQTIDYIHMNAIAVDNDSNIVVSCRHLSEITKINRKTGKVMWRFGGKNNQFTYVNDPLNGPSYQHDIRVLSNGNYTMMDNGNFHSPALSRAVEYKLDTVAMTATLVWQYRHTPDRYSWWMGNVQRLPNGNTLINWADGSLPKLTEVTPAGVKVMELDFVKSAHSYRVFKFPWKGKAKAPTLSIETGTDKITMLVNKFDQEPSHKFMLYIDTIPNPNRLIDSTSLNAVDLTGFKNGKRYYFRVTTKDSLGFESPFSNEENILVKFFKPGENFVVNGDFSDGTNQWSYNITSPAAGLPFINTEGEFFVQIGNGGTQAFHVQLVQEGIPLVTGLKYRLEFDAYAMGNRTMEPKVAMVAVPNTNYSKTSAIALTTTKKHFSFDFTMNDVSDNNARVVFNCGLSDIDVIIDNVSVKQLIAVGVNNDIDRVPNVFLLQQNFPNPFNPETIITYSLAENSDVTLKIHDILGREVAQLVDQRQISGTHRVLFSLLHHHQLPSGIYFYTLTAGSFTSTKRMIVLK